MTLEVEGVGGRGRLRGQGVGCPMEIADVNGAVISPALYETLLATTTYNSFSILSTGIELFGPYWGKYSKVS